jgi:hypothetical protein
MIAFALVLLILWGCGDYRDGGMSNQDIITASRTCYDAGMLPRPLRNGYGRTMIIECEPPTPAWDEHLPDVTADISALNRQHRREK